jgi:mannose-1-phosphate guanylyltransferase
MKAFLLAAGYGSRLRPITDTIPKCLVPIRGKPLLGWWFELLSKHKYRNVLVNTHYLSTDVRDYLHTYNTKPTGLTAYEFYEDVLLGSGGTVKANRQFIDTDEPFAICYADNLTNINLSAMLAYHQNHRSVLTMALFRCENPKACGIAKLDSSNCIVGFTEKPPNPQSNLANAGIYIANRELFDYFPESSFCDFGKDVLPGLVGKMYGWETHEYLIDIGTPENYQKVQEEWKA